MKNNSLLILNGINIVSKFHYSKNPAEKVIFQCPELVGIEEYAFADSLNIEKIDLRNCTNLEYISQFGFYGCRSLTDVFLPSSLKILSHYAFANCSQLKFVEIPKNSHMQSLHKFAFSETNITSFYITKKLQRVELGVFAKCFNLKEIIISSNPVFVFENGALYNNVTGEILFYSLVNEQKIYKLPPQVQIVQSYSFCYAKVEEVIFHPQIRALNLCSFSYSHLHKVVIASEFDNMKISTDVFRCCLHLKSVDFSQCNFIHIINSHDFYNCTSLVSVAFPVNLERIADHAFAFCPNLENISIPENCQLTGIRDYCFYNCTKLKSFFISWHLGSIGDDAFGNTNLVEFVISPANEVFRFVNNTLFDIKQESLCFYLFKAELNVSEYSTHFPVKILRNKCFYKAYNLNSIIIPNTVTTILHDAISYTSITRLILPKSLKIIKEWCFAFNKWLEYIEFNSAIIRVPSYCFAGCRNLKCINFVSPPIFAQNIFSNCSSLCCIYFGDNIVKKAQNIKNAIPTRILADQVCPITVPPIEIV